MGTRDDQMGYDFLFRGAALTALGSGALWWADEAVLCVSDLHLGKSERIARRGGAFLPPYETQDTLSRLETDIVRTGARTVVCLGDSFDDLTSAEALHETHRDWITRLMAGRDWIWIEGNHDPGPLSLGGTHLAELSRGPLVFRHIAEPGEAGEVSGHYHPKARLGRITRPAFLVDQARLILPAYGTYTGGLHSHDEVLRDLMGPEALAILTGSVVRAFPMPRGAKRRARN